MTGNISTEAIAVASAIVLALQLNAFYRRRWIAGPHVPIHR